MVRDHKDMLGGALFYALLQKAETTVVLFVEPVEIQRAASVPYPAEIADGRFRPESVLQRYMRPESRRDQLGIFS